MTTAQAQFDNTANGDVNLSDPGWVKVGETFEVLNNGTGTDRFEHWGKFDATGTITDLILVLIRNALGTGLSLPSSNQFNYDLVAPNPQVTYIDGNVVDGSRVTLPATTAPLELSQLGIQYSGAGDSNRFVFANNQLGTGGNPHSIPTPWIDAFGFHTDEEGDEPGSVTNGTGAIPVHWKPGTTTATTPVDVGTIDQSADTDNDGQLTVLEWKNHMIALGFTNIHHIFVTTQSFGDFTSSFSVSDVPINTTPLADIDIIPAGDFNLYVTLLDTSGKAISSNYGAWVTGTVDLSTPDTTPPTAVCQDITLSLDSSGTVTITAADIDGGSTDDTTAVGDLVRSISQISFSCADLASPVSVTLTVTDEAGNSSSCTASVTIVDDESPTLSCIEDQEVLIPLGEQYTVPDYTSQITTSDNCSATVSQTPSAGSLLDIGTYMVTLTASDGSSVSPDTVCTFSLEIDHTMSVTDPQLDTTLTLYPNPTSDYFTVSRGSEQIDASAMTIYDMSGKIVARQTTDVSGLSSGMYLVRIDLESRSQTLRLIKK
jgi:hypothetical protein